MKNYIKFLFIVLSLLSVPGISRAQGFFSNPNGVLSSAHQAYLSGDFKAMAVELKTALEQHPNDPIVRENALDLLKSAYEASGSGEIPVDWRLPDEIKYMKVGVKHSFKDGSYYNFRVYGSTIHKHSIFQIQVTQYPDRVVLDKQAHVGDWNDEAGIDDVTHDYELQTSRSRQFVPGGLYLMTLVLNDGSKTNGWFIMGDNENSTSNPRIFVPSEEEVFNTSTPTFSWENFTSPQYQFYEKRSLWVGISRSEPPHYNWDEIWGHFEGPPAITQITIDSNGDENSVNKLENGHYVFFVDYHERKKFGDLQITRDSIGTKNFRIAK